MKIMVFWKLIANVIVWAARRASRAVGAANMLVPLRASIDVVERVMQEQWREMFGRELREGLRIAQSKAGLT